MYLLRIFTDCRSVVACGATGLFLVLSAGVSADTKTENGLRGDDALAPPAAAAGVVDAEQPPAPTLDVQFAKLEERLQTEPAQNVIRAAVQLLRDHPQEATKEHIALVDDWLTEELKTDPKSVILRILVTELLDAQGRQDDLIKHYRELLKDPAVIGQARAIVANNLAYALATRGEQEVLPEADAAIAAAIKELGSIPDLLDTRATVGVAKGDLKAAREDLQSAIKECPGALFYFHLALLEEKAGNRDAARAAMKQSFNLKVERNQIPPPERKAFDRLKAETGEKK